jgi:arylsulfatase A-like enzyme
VLFVTLDQFRADAMAAAGHPLVRTPHLDSLCAEGVRLARHYSQSAPCAPGRAALYTGTYQMNNRVVYNGTPLASGFDNVAKLARRAGYDPTLFGYTDQAIDPWVASGPDDPRLEAYSGVLEGFAVACQLDDDQTPWVEFLRERGYEVSDDGTEALRDEASRPAEHSLSAFLTDQFLDWLERRDGPWFAHLSYLRPHPPYNAAGEYSTMYHPDDVPAPIEPVPYAERHYLHKMASKEPASAAPSDPAAVRALRAQYYGMVSEVDAQLGRVVAALRARGEWDRTLVVVTADHGDQLGDHGLKEKLGFFPQSYHILGIWRDPRRPDRAGRVIERFTENVDVMPTLADALGLEVPVQCDGRVLTPLLDGRDVEWRTSAHYEWDYRAFFIARDRTPWPLDRTLSRCNLATTVTDDWAFVHFGDGTSMAFDLVADPTWRTTTEDPAVLYAGANAQLQWRQEHLRRDLTDLLVLPGRPGRWPAVPYAAR